MEKPRLAVMKQSRGCEAQHREYSQQRCGNYVRSQAGTGNAKGNPFLVLVG